MTDVETPKLMAVYINHERFIPEIALRTGMPVAELRRSYSECRDLGEEFWFATYTYDDRPLDVLEEEHRLDLESKRFHYYGYSEDPAMHHDVLMVLDHQGVTDEESAAVWAQLYPGDIIFHNEENR